MKKYAALLASLVFGLSALTGCGAAGPGTAGSGPREEEEPKTPALSALAALDSVDTSAVFGDGELFALEAAGGLNADYTFRFLSEISDEEKLNLRLGGGLELSDVIGVRSDPDAIDASLFGGGQVSLSLYYGGPSADSETVSKRYDVGFRHDGDLIWYAGADGEESSLSLSELKGKIEGAAVTETLRRMETAFVTIPEEVNKGFSLRFAVEKLIDLGFTAEIDETDGIAVLLKANKAFYTDLLNDMLEKFIPADFLKYIPRFDFGYEKTVFDILLSFDTSGVFREYSMSSDVALRAGMELRSVFRCDSLIQTGGTLSFTAHDGEVPEFGGSAEEAA